MIGKGDREFLKLADARALVVGSFELLRVRKVFGPSHFVLEDPISGCGEKITVSKLRSDYIANPGWAQAGKKPAIPQRLRRQPGRREI
jgi:hypothetical protein